MSHMILLSNIENGKKLKDSSCQRYVFIQWRGMVEFVSMGIQHTGIGPRKWRRVGERWRNFTARYTGIPFCCIGLRFCCWKKTNDLIYLTFLTKLVSNLISKDISFFIKSKVTLGLTDLDLPLIWWSCLYRCCCYCCWSCLNCCCYCYCLHCYCWVLVLPMNWTDSVAAASLVPFF